MKFAQLGPIGAEIPALVTDSATYDLRAITAKIDGAFLESGIPEAQRLLDAGELPVLDGAAEMRIGSPIARPSALVCVGMNYAAHAAESGSAPPENMVIFNKLPNTVVGPNDVVVIPKGSVKTDWEVELGIVIGKRASYIESLEAAEDYIAGYVVVNDLSERTWQIDLSGGQWGKGKSAPGFSPTGPWLVTRDEVDAQNVRLRSSVNGETRQDSTTADMIFSIAHIVHELSQYMVLEPGDLVLTGTPEGVALSGRFPYLAAGDVVEVSIDGLGGQRQEYVAYEEAN
ncbi:Ureidoglycolate lyase [Leucobacter aridicollis]|uniref:fumarylacetoacetate hydrolase family protein n=1 Tax=Leucobacter aridicollis TaxID=283878 RepID=UPI000EB2D305|nr:fumarylacetoacetate hydrolase family protein [Leucobacter aridicollis]MCS3429091.1 2-keto-4-pentenoate hydratase/2-oxohepta-3-ene-1,7-dioic acid hydratase in catechol pathway [Leucobacter aridicollis]RKQ85692.1 2-keto-4-pentenoate hydratase/2-oxohepta-3-ene-1,7-dioic acid hydratase in catechol pathway [Mycolicibacterium mucogenicum 261Sha1.1M5]